MANISSKKQGTRSFEKTPETYNHESKGTLVQSKLYIFASDTRGAREPNP